MISPASKIPRNKSSKRGKADVVKMSAQISTLLSAQRKMVQNHKYIVASNNSTSLTNGAPASFCINPCLQGTDESNRIGDRAKFNWLEMGFQVSNSATTSQLQYNVRLMVVKETSSLGAAVSVVQLMDSSTPTSTSNRNYITRDHNRFKVFYDSGPIQVFPNGSLVPAGSAGTIASYNIVNMGGPSNVVKRIRIPLNFTTDYSRGNSGTVTDIDTNGLSVVVFTDNTNASTINYSVHSTLEFIDS